MNYFPTSLVTGKAFCNRKKELKRIHYNLEKHIPTLLISPRRYGKTSLALQAFETIKKPYCHVDLYKALSEEDITRYILNGIGKLLGKLENTPQKLMKVAADFFSGIQLKFTHEKFGLAVELSKPSSNSADLILDALEKLDTFILRRKKQAILFLDEFQVLAEVVKNNSIEAAIREAAQKAKALHYVFSGSHRHLIESMFNDKNKPFYNLCDQMTLKRIEEEHYVKYINHAAKLTWGEHLSTKSLEAIFNIAKYHPYYTNKLCSLAWQSEKPPSEKTIQQYWQEYVDENKSRVEQELNLLSLNQRKTLIYLAQDEKVQEPSSKTYILKWSMPSTSIHRAITTLTEKDYVFIDEKNYYKILDPLYQAVLGN